ncbi:LexA family protein [Haloimpatiens massiliensis]|uniref:LexA family protein n=1 Tax=Haloimpatiens massiliensis TaxID=1658110 RepID=UPI000C847F58|nr:transcriptional regulator [Haloimpatiens massiliensis]
MELTDKEEALLQAIKNYMESNHISTTVRGLTKMLNFKSTSTVHRYLENLEKKGYISKKTSSPRTIVLKQKF